MSCAGLLAASQIYTRNRAKHLKSHSREGRNLFDFLHNLVAVSLCDVMWMTRGLLAVVATFLMATPACLSSSGSGVLPAHLNSVSKALSFFFSLRAGYQNLLPLFIINSILRIGCLHCWFTGKEQPPWCYRDRLFSRKTRCAGCLDIGEGEARHYT